VPAKDNEEPRMKKREVRYLLEKVEMLFVLGRDMSIAAMGRKYGVKEKYHLFQPGK
jgi:hypothetical protein